MSFVCPQCGKKFGKEGWLAHHLLKVHNIGTGAAKQVHRPYGWLVKMNQRVDALEARVAVLEKLRGVHIE